MGKFNTITPRASNPVTLQEAKDYARVDISDDDDLISSLITSATNFTEVYCNTVLVDTEIEYATSSFGSSTGFLSFPNSSSCIEIPKQNIKTVNSVQYYDEDDNIQTVSSSVYKVDYTSVYPILFLQEGQSWPSDLSANRPNDVIINFNGGETDTADVSEQAKVFIKMQVTDMYEHRMTEIEDETQVNTTSLMILNNLRMPYI